MIRLVGVFFSALALASCAVRDAGSSAGRGPIQAELQLKSPEFALVGHREVKAVYSVRNAGKKKVQLDFPTAQHMELTLRASDQRSLFVWSEDRLFPAMPSVIVINPGERLEYEVDVPTRDMVAGDAYTVEAALVGYPNTRAVGHLRPR